MTADTPDTPRAQRPFEDGGVWGSYVAYVQDLEREALLLRAERDSLAARLEAARFGCENCSDIERLGAKHFNDLLDARTLLAEFETREEWAALDHGSIVEWATEEAARGNAAWLRERDPDARVMRRTVHTGPWREDES